MPKKKSAKIKKEVKSKKKNSIEQEIKHELKEVEDWIIEKRKFLIKLAWVVGFILALLIISHIYLRVAGAGV